MSLMLSSSERAVLDGARAGEDRRFDPSCRVCVRRDRHAEARGFVDDRGQLVGAEVRAAGIVAVRHLQRKMEKRIVLSNAPDDLCSVTAAVRTLARGLIPVEAQQAPWSGRRTTTG